MLVYLRMADYRRKHPPEARPDPALVEAIQEVEDEGCVGCAVAHDLAEELEVTPAAVGRTLDLMEYRIVKCQMGIFGYTTEKKILRPATKVDEHLRERLEAATSKGRISCAVCWKIAESLGLQKIEVAAGCETLGLKIKPCQLGAF